MTSFWLYKFKHCSLFCSLGQSSREDGRFTNRYLLLTWQRSPNWQEMTSTLGVIASYGPSVGSLTLLSRWTLVPHVTSSWTVLLYPFHAASCNAVLPRYAQTSLQSSILHSKQYCSSVGTIHRNIEYRNNSGVTYRNHIQKCDPQTKTMPLYSLPLTLPIMGKTVWPHQWWRSRCQWNREERATCIALCGRRCSLINTCLLGGSAAEWLACCTQAQKGLGSNRCHDAVG